MLKSNKSKKAIIAYCAKRNEQILKFRQKGWSVAEIADRYQVTDARIYQILGELRKKNRKVA